MDASKVQTAVAVMVPTEWYVNGEAYFAVTALPEPLQKPQSLQSTPASATQL